MVGWVEEIRVEDMAVVAAATQGVEEDSAAAAVEVDTGAARASMAKAAAAGGTRWRALEETHPSTTLCGSSFSSTKTVRHGSEMACDADAFCDACITVPYQYSFLLVSSDPLETAGDGHLDINELPPALYGLLNYDANNDGRELPHPACVLSMPRFNSLDPPLLPLPPSFLHSPRQLAVGCCGALARW